MIKDQIDALIQAVKGLTDLTGSDFETRYNLVREAAQALKTAIANDVDHKGKNYHGLLLILDRLLVLRFCSQKQHNDLLQFLELLEGRLDKLKPSADDSTVPAQQWSTQERLTDFSDPSNNTAQQSLRSVLDSWSLNKDGTVAQRLQHEGIGTIKAIQIEKNDFQLEIKSPLYEGVTKYHRQINAAGETTVTMRLPTDHIYRTDHISSVMLKRYQEQAKITVLAELALLRTVHGEKTDQAFAEFIKASPPVFNPADANNRYDRAYCKALRDAYVELTVDMLNPHHTSTVAPTTVNPPPAEKKDDSAPTSSHVFSAKLEVAPHSHVFRTEVENKPLDQGHTFSASVACQPMGQGMGSTSGLHSEPLDHSISAIIGSHYHI